MNWLAADAQGTVDLQVAVATGILTPRLQDPFGQPRGASTTTWADGHGFLNATTDSLSSLTQLGARMYDASIGRFLSVDPVLSPTEPQQNNGYSYAHNSPVDLADASGMMPVCDSSVCHQSVSPGVPSGGATPTSAGKGGEASKKNGGKSSGFDLLAGFKIQWDFDVDFDVGFGQAASATGQALWAGSPINYLIQAATQGPAEAWKSLNSYGMSQAQATLTFIKDPGGTTVSILGNMVDAKDWSKHPGKSAGTVGFSVVLAALTFAGGAGIAGVAGDGAAVAGEGAAAEGAVATSDASLSGSAAEIAAPYARPSGATTLAQRASVQGQACVDCGVITSRQVADHILPLVKEYYGTGTINLNRMTSLEAVQPQCPTCSAIQGAAMSRYSVQMRSLLGLDK